MPRSILASRKTTTRTVRRKLKTFSTKLNEKIARPHSELRPNPRRHHLDCIVAVYSAKSFSSDFQILANIVGKKRMQHVFIRYKRTIKPYSLLP